MKYNKIPDTTFQEIQLNAGVLLSSFEPTTGAIELTNIIGATSGGVNFTDTPEFADFGEDIDNCPKGTKELKKMVSREIMLSGSYVTVTPENVKSMMGAADISGTKITPRMDLLDTDFTDIWWVGDYSDKNGETNGGFVAIHMMNTLSTAGFQMQSTDKEKGKFDFEYQAHFTISDQTVVPYEVYVKAGTDEE